MSVYAYVLKGKHDAQLTWPFVGEITVTLLNQLENRNHCGKTIVVKECSMLVRDNWGYPMFIAHSKLGRDQGRNTQYLKDDTLYFRVSVDIPDHKPWLECTMK